MGLDLGNLLRPLCFNGPQSYDFYPLMFLLGHNLERTDMPLMGRKLTAFGESTLILRANVSD
jgi:hypothetical protein